MCCFYAHRRHQKAEGTRHIVSEGESRIDSSSLLLLLLLLLLSLCPFWGRHFQNNCRDCLHINDSNFYGLTTLSTELIAGNCPGILKGFRQQFVAIYLGSLSLRLDNEFSYKSCTCYNGVFYMTNYVGQQLTVDN